MEWLLSYPASGYRVNISGAISGMDTHGHTWHSVVSGTHSYLLRYIGADVQPESTRDRTYGFSVRCVQYLSFLLKVMCSLTWCVINKVNR